MMEKRDVNIDDKLSVVRYKVDKNAHIKINTESCEDCRPRPCISACPAGNYSENSGTVIFHYEGCLECGTCRFICPENAIDWSYPRGGFGVSFRRG